MRLQNKRAIVTGGGRGIGRAIALAFAREGASVCVVSRTASQVREVARQIREMGTDSLALQCDVSLPEQVQEAVDTAAGQFGGLDILVNNAGGDFVRQPLLESDPSDWRRVIESNLMGTYHCCRAAIGRLIEAGGGKIINVGSGMGHTARGGNSAYNTAKAGVWMMTRCLALEVWQYGIEVNELIPGPVHTRLTEDVFDPAKAHPWVESERIKPPEECVPLAIYLASHPPGGPTGQSFSLARRPL